ncbi:MAG: CinA family protein [Proteobacteria bacterium]|nr:CinA family protein [Pseudomonadota bacterium]
MVDYENLLLKSEKLGKILRERNKKIAFAESCTGGLLSSIITEIPGSSDYFERAYITYSNQAKIEMLGVNKDVIEKFGAVSYECAKEMVEKLKKLSLCDICVSITGIAGPTGGTMEKPVGLVYTGFFIDNELFIEKNFFNGLRQEVRYSTIDFVLNFLLKKLSSIG